MTVSYRPATQADVSLILTFIRELADYEKLLSEVKADEATLTRHMFGNSPKSRALIAEVNGEAAGFALYFFNFSTFLGKPGIYIEDVYVREKHRNLGIGKGFFRQLAKIAMDEDCGRVEWWVLDWNKSAIGFYEKLGAQAMDEWTVYRLTGEKLKALAEE
ncbi:MAG: GNAT family N-acetyltransferase [Proteobacteria bacterium]|nr:GNAT family N-acetyltransferase [Pseudomonadota bacterium]